MKKHSRLCIWLLIMSALILLPEETQSQYRFRHYRTGQNMLSNQSTLVVQDGLGFIWFSNFVSLTRFDGYDFKVYIHDPKDSLLNLGHFPLGGIGRHENLAVDPSGTIWLNQTMYEWESGFLLKHDRKTDGFIRYKPDLKGASIHSLHFEKEGPIIWLGTVPGRGLFRFNIESGETIQYLNLQGKESHSLERGTPEEGQNAIFDISEHGSFLLLATWRGLWKFDKNLKVISRPQCDPRDSVLLYHSSAYRFYHNTNDKSTWVLAYLEGMRVVLFKLREDLSVVRRFDFPLGFDFNYIDLDNEEVFWIATTKGLYRYDPDDGSLTNLKHIPGDPFSLGSDVVSAVVVDKNQNVWAATDKGIDQLPRKSAKFYNSSLDKTLQFGLGSSLIMNINGIDHVVALGGGSYIWTSPLVLSDSLPFKRFEFEGQNDVESYFIAGWRGKHKLWIATYGRGVIGLPLDEAGMIQPSPVSYYSHSFNNPNSISRDAALSIYEDTVGNVWAGTFVELNKIVPSIPYGKSGSVSYYRHDRSDSTSLGNNGIYEIYPEGDGTFWLATFAGVDLFANGKIERVFKTGERVRTVTKASSGKLYIGTDRGMFVGEKHGDRFSFSKSKAMPHGVFSISEDRLSRVWVAGSWGVACYDPKLDIAIRFGEIDGIVEPSNYGPQSLAQSSSGRMIFKGFSGISVFDPASVKISNVKTTPVLTGLKINNRQAVVAARPYEKDDFIVQSDVTVLDELELDYSHNNFAIQFSAMEMTAPEKNLYRHKLDGYDNDWIETDFRDRTATYTNLDAGEYTFRVRASNHHGIWSNNERILKIRVLPPPWKTNWAYTGYGFIFLGLLYAARKNIVQRERLKSNLKLAKVEREKEHFELEKAKEVDKVKSAFFANISHEFRTPLTLIKGPAQELSEEFADHSRVKDRVKVIERNADLVLKLINQLLDLAKLESGTLLVEKTENDLNNFLNVVINSFSSLTFQKNITMELELPDEKNVVSFDKDKVETVLINLINNAIKFTPPGGAVAVRAKLTRQTFTKSQSTGTAFRRRGAGLSVHSEENAEGGVLVLVVSDTGIGIEETQHEKIFERFHQVSDSHDKVGTGIGLSLVKEFVGLMKGNISLKSKLGQGSEFSVVLPVEVIGTVSELEEIARITAPTKSQDLLSNANGHESLDNKPRILVVEDNSDLRKFIIRSLGHEFYFMEAVDGKQGLQTAFDETPDLIISDVMMPEMDGITMTGKLKGDTRTSHIPLVLLTAKSSDESKLSGLRTGADDYLTKPFNKQELLLKVRNRIALQVKLSEKIRLELLKESPKVEGQSADEKFLLKVKEIILARLSDELLSVDSLAEEIALSRAQLFRKIKALTGASVNELIRMFRLQKAALLLEQDWGPVSQVAYEVGFPNLSYFSKVFKEQYGVLPTAYLSTNAK